MKASEAISFTVPGNSRDPNYKSYVPQVTEEMVRDVIAKLNMKVKSQVIVDLVMGRYTLVN